MANKTKAQLIEENKALKAEAAALKKQTGGNKAPLLVEGLHRLDAPKISKAVGRQVSDLVVFTWYASIIGKDARSLSTAEKTRAFVEYLG